MSKHKKNKIPKTKQSSKKIPLILSNNDTKNNGNNQFIILSLRYIQYDFQCFFQWDKTEMKHFWEFQSKLYASTWQDVYNSGGKRNKTGFAYTPILTEKYPNSNFKNDISNDVSFFELRVSGDIRVHGYRNKNIFYVCWLDKNHNICK